MIHGSILLWAAVAAAEPPKMVEGRYDVVEMQEAGGEKQPFVEKMKRRAMALGQDCYTSARRYHFGDAPLAAGATTVAITEQVTCKKGGLGTYRAEAILEVEASWTAGDPAELTLEGGTAWIAMTRLQKPRDVGIPAQWAAPEFQWVVQPATYQITAEKVWGRKVAPLVLTDGNERYVLKPLEADGSDRKPRSKK